jgi:hypothetical protein
VGYFEIPVAMHEESRMGRPEVKAWDGFGLTSPKDRRNQEEPWEGRVRFERDGGMEQDESGI